ncbi:hypothetical protein [Promicromonospora kroppenstedtii]|uniref:DUF7246 family protein n=1 Tax=Promicromonospora kroppenstedtii TaxID=440482 RepID=UPI0004AE287B|nr:hypothetical protein [Promicromonospora kroppenstedtii]
MAKRRVPVPHHDPSADWTRSTTHTSAKGRHIGPGTEFSVYGEPGRFRFVEHVTTPAGVEWVTGHGGPRKVRVCRSFRPERIKRVHTKKTYVSPEEARRLVNEKNRAKREAAR